MTVGVDEPVDWEAIETALHEWLVVEREIVPEFIFEQQGGTQPDYPYASAQIIAQEKIGGVPEKRITEVPEEEDPALGEELKIAVTSQLEFTLQFSFHVDREAGGWKPTTSAMTLAIKAQASLGLPSVLEILRAANVAVVRELGVRNTSVVVNGEWLSRATLDVRFRTATELSERAGYIEKVGLVSEDFGVDITLDSTEE